MNEADVLQTDEMVQGYLLVLNNLQRHPFCSKSITYNSLETRSQILYESQWNLS